MFSFTVKQMNSQTFVSMNQLHSSTVLHYTIQINSYEINSYEILNTIKYHMKQSQINLHTTKPPKTRLKSRLFKVKELAQESLFLVTPLSSITEYPVTTVTLEIHTGLPIQTTLHLGSTQEPYC